MRQDPSVVVPYDFSRHSRASEVPKSDIYELFGGRGKRRILVTAPSRMTHSRRRNLHTSVLERKITNKCS